MSDAAPGYQRILVPVDFSPRSAHALTYALGFGALFASTVDALHVWRTNTETPVSVARERATVELRSFTATAAPSGRAKLRRRTDYGDPYLTILRIAQLSAYDLMVLVAPRPGQSEALSLGLLRASRVPVLLVPSAWMEGRKQPDLKRHLRRVLLPAAFAGRAPGLLGRVGGLLSALDARLELAFVSQGAAAEQERAARELAEEADLLPQVERRDLTGTLESALEERAREGGYDLLVMAAERGGVDQRNADPVVSRVVALQRCPTLCERFDASG
jgi:nucleotide-binding universal stress UspA family protein